MKSLGLSIIALFLCSTLSFAQSSTERFNKLPFAANTERLCRYLEVSSGQAAEIASINAFFIEQQKEGLRTSTKNQYQKMQTALRSNLKLMKDVLTPEQYRKYVVLLNLTNNNNEQKVFTDSNPYLFALN